MKTTITPEELAKARCHAMQIVRSNQDDVIVVRFSDAPGAVAHGHSIVEVATQGADAIIRWLAALRDAGLSVPSPRRQSAYEEADPNSPTSR